MITRKRRARRGNEMFVGPSLTSLMDIITIILVYLIKNFSSSPFAVQDPAIQLPISSSIESVEDLVVVMVTGKERQDFMPDGRPVNIPVVPTISVDDAVVMQLDDEFQVPPGQLQGQFIIAALKQKLLEVRKMQGVTAELTEAGGFNAKLVFVMDKHVPFDTLAKLMASAAQAGYGDFKFAIIKSEG